MGRFPRAPVAATFALGYYRVAPLGRNGPTSRARAASPGVCRVAQVIGHCFRC